MMGVGELATAAVALVGPYVAKGAEELAKKVGAEVGSRVVKLWDALKAKLAGKEALADFEKQPEDADQQASLRVQLRKALEADPEFRAEVTRLVEAIPTEQRAAIQQIANVTGNQNVTPQIAGSGNQVTIGRT
jgi:hypothetical protein